MCWYLNCQHGHACEVWRRCEETYWCWVHLVTSHRLEKMNTACWAHVNWFYHFHVQRTFEACQRWCSVIFFHCTNSVKQKVTCIHQALVVCLELNLGFIPEVILNASRRHLLAVFSTIIHQTAQTTRTATTENHSYYRQPVFYKKEQWRILVGWPTKIQSRPSSVFVERTFRGRWSQRRETKEFLNVWQN